ncbi:DUF6301 family protein [Buchananella hordeovulneris]|uniref:DUF6301 family protein n=1 Tax=Buchananella hordeovulneris TaxID=52770 RepID=UPI0011610208|nr:DUF6301 family protein [Buchananella hordeovulneris]
MAVFRVLPIERCLELITAWTEAPWPITTEQGWEIARALGWEQDPNNTFLFYSELPRGDEGDCICNSMDGLTSWVAFPLATRNSGEKEDVVTPAIAKSAQHLLLLLTENYGGPTLSKSHNGINVNKWELPSGISVRISHSGTMFRVAISSPEVVRVLNDPRSDPDYERL